MRNKTLPIIFMAIGVGVFAYGTHLADQASAGQQRISQAEENWQGGQRPVLGPIRRHARTEASQNAQRQIGNQEQIIAISQVNANWVRGSGVAIFLIGLASLIMSVARNKRS